LGAVLPLAILVFETFVGRNRDLRYRGAGRRVLHFGIFAKIAEKNDFITLFPAMNGLLQTALGGVICLDLDTIAALRGRESGNRLGKFRNGKVIKPFTAENAEKNS